jgi:transcriptional regulator with XRE-family HTH domain
VAEAWFEVADRVRRERGLSQDDLAYEARKHGAPKALNSSWYSKVKRGDRPLTTEFLTGIAGALKIPPETFAEYRLAIARQQLDEQIVGLDGALANLRELEAAAAGGRSAPAPPQGGFLSRLLASAETTPRDQAASAKKPAAKKRTRSSRRKAA